MHLSALNNCQHFFDTYAAAFNSQNTVKVIEIGSQDINGSLRGTAPSNFEYVGVDFVAGRGVDLILTDPYILPFTTASADIVISSSCFEHSEMFWLVFLEIMRVLKPKGLFYLNVPANGSFHRFPVDCWRFYPDSGRALVTWAKKNSINATLLESYTSSQAGSHYNDFVAVFLKDEALASDFPARILNSKSDITNGVLYGSDELIKPSEMYEDQKKLAVISQVISNQIRVV